MSDVIGIDLGTTYSVVSIFNESTEQVDVLTNQDGDRTTPSVVAVGEDGAVMVGRAAKRYQTKAPDATVKEVKRHMGSLDKLNIRDKELSPQGVSSMILRYLKESAEERLGRSLKRAVITCPAHFDESRRAATIQAGDLAGLQVLQIINEPTAAALAYGLISSEAVSDAYADEYEEEEDQEITNVLIYDLGGGTLDVTVFKLFGNTVQVLATNGDQYLGGTDFDREIANWIFEQIKDQYGVDLSNNPKVVARVQTEAEVIKQDLSSTMTRSITLFGLGVTPDGDVIEFDGELSRPEFEELISPWLDKGMKCVEAALEGARLSPDEIDEVLLVGGSSRIPAVQRRLKHYFGQDPQSTLDPDLCVSMGAAILGATFPDEYDQTATVGGAEAAAPEGEAPPMPPPEPSKGPDVGQIIDVVGHSLGVAVMEETADGRLHEVFSVLVPRFTPIPVQQTRSYSTMHHTQTEVVIRVYQGENKNPQQNYYLGEVQLVGIAPRTDPTARARIDVTFSLDVNGVLSVSAIDVGSGKSQDVDFEFKGTAKLDKDQAEEELRKLREIYDQERATQTTQTQDAIPDVYKKYWDRAQDLKDRLEGNDRAELEAVMDDFHAALAGQGSVEAQWEKLLDTLLKHQMDRTLGK